MKVITLAPNIPGPYNTMGAIYEHQGKKDKALDCYMIAAHLNKLVRGVATCVYTTAWVELGGVGLASV
jgi:Tfp pilus assembly protein PilF